MLLVIIAFKLFIPANHAVDRAVERLIVLGHHSDRSIKPKFFINSETSRKREVEAIFKDWPALSAASSIV